LAYILVGPFTKQDSFRHRTHENMIIPHTRSRIGESSELVMFSDVVLELFKN
jgi:hypothetical protein